MKVSDLKIGDRIVADRNLWPETIVGGKKHLPVQRGDVGIIEEISSASIDNCVISVRFHKSQITLYFLASYPDYEVSFTEI